MNGSPSRHVSTVRVRSRALLYGALLLTFVSLGVTSSPADAGHSWGNYHWARIVKPFTLGMGDNVSGEWDRHLTTAKRDWSVPTALDTMIVRGFTKPNLCRPTSGRVEVCAAKYGRRGWLGIATIWVVGDHIVQATAQMNDTYFDREPYNTPAWKRLVMCQEVGHTFGLDHQDEAFDNPNLGSCMDYTSDPDGPPSNEHPNAHDYDQLDTIYAHQDDSTTVGSGTSDDSAGSGHSPEDWGRVVKRDAHGKPSVYERDRGGGRKAFTFVIWAE